MLVGCVPSLRALFVGRDAHFMVIGVCVRACRRAGVRACVCGERDVSIAMIPTHKHTHTHTADAMETLSAAMIPCMLLLLGANMLPEPRCV